MEAIGAIGAIGAAADIGAIGGITRADPPDVIAPQGSQPDSWLQRDVVNNTQAIIHRTQRLEIYSDIRFFLGQS